MKVAFFNNNHILEFFFQTLNFVFMWCDWHLTIPACQKVEKKTIKTCNFFFHYWSTRPPTVTAYRDHGFHTRCPSVRPSPLFKTHQFSRAVDLAEWIIDDTCLVFLFSLILKVIGVTLPHWDFLLKKNKISPIILAK